eukprot:6457067-Lingulodinium_polyedra.AAC.1
MFFKCMRCSALHLVPTDANGAAYPARYTTAQAASDALEEFILGTEVNPTGFAPLSYFENALLATGS